MPIIYSLNRGMWIGIGLAVVVAAVRLALYGRIKALLVVLAVLTVAGGVLAASPLENLVSARAETGHSNEVRGSLLGTAIGAAESSPVVGFGSTRKTAGQRRVHRDRPLRGLPQVRCAATSAAPAS